MRIMSDGREKTTEGGESWFHGGKNKVFKVSATLNSAGLKMTINNISGGF
jgi:hypothetical protein